jgi:hypothetical protein
MPERPWLAMAIRVSPSLAAFSITTSSGFRFLTICATATPGNVLPVFDPRLYPRSDSNHNRGGYQQNRKVGFLTQHA